MILPKPDIPRSEARFALSFRARSHAPNFLPTTLGTETGPSRQPQTMRLEYTRRRLRVKSRARSDSMRPRLKLMQQAGLKSGYTSLVVWSARRPKNRPPLGPADARSSLPLASCMQCATSLGNIPDKALATGKTNELSAR
jgi:hypothetical protein